LGSLFRLQALEKLGQLLAIKPPLERTGLAVGQGLLQTEPLLNLGQADKIIGRQDLPLDNRKVEGRRRCYCQHVADRLRDHAGHGRRYPGSQMLLLFDLSTGVALRQPVAQQQALAQVIALVLGDVFHRPEAIPPSGWGCCSVWTDCPARTLKPWSQRGRSLLTDYIQTPSGLSDEAG
jgi:hypothetical protein